MRPAVLDTDVVSFLFKNDSRAQIYLPRLQNRSWLISFMTEAELEHGFSCQTGAQPASSGCGSSLANSSLVPSSRDLVLKWAEVMVAARRGGRRIETADAWVAATALLYDATLLTHNRADYLGVPNLRFDDD